MACLLLGTRVVSRGEQEDGDILGTLIGISNPSDPKEEAVIQWDSGNVSKADPYDETLLIFDNATAGVSHKEKCSHCREVSGIRGIRWKCSDEKCDEINLCNSCYHGDRHNIRHSFQYFLASSSNGISVESRKGATKYQALGIAVGAKVIKGFERYNAKKLDIDDDEAFGEGHLEENEEEIGEGEVIGFSDRWDGKEACNIAEVRYSKSKPTEMYRVGHNGVVDIMCTETGQEAWGMYYKSHLPVFEKQMKMETFRKRDVVLVKDLDIPELRRLQTEIGGWSERMKRVGGCRGLITELVESGGKTYPRVIIQREVFTFNPTCLELVDTKRTENLPSTPGLDLDHVLTPDWLLWNLTESVPKDKWEDLAKCLGLKVTDTASIKLAHPTSSEARVFNMLMLWRDRNKARCDIMDMLKDACIKAGLPELAEEHCGGAGVTFPKIGKSETSEPDSEGSSKSLPAAAPSTKTIKMGQFVKVKNFTKKRMRDHQRKSNIPWRNAISKTVGKLGIVLAAEDGKVTVLLRSGGHFDYNPECLHRGAEDLFEAGDIVQIKEDISLTDMKKYQAIDTKWAPVIEEMKGQMGAIEVVFFDHVIVKMESGEIWTLHHFLLQKVENTAQFNPQRGIKKGDRVKVKDLSKEDMDHYLQKYGYSLDNYVQNKSGTVTAVCSGGLINVKFDGESKERLAYCTPCLDVLEETEDLSDDDIVSLSDIDEEAQIHSDEHGGKLEVAITVGLHRRGVVTPKTLLDASADGKHTKIQTILKKYPKWSDYISENGMNTPMMNACSQGHLKAVEVLKENKADVELSNVDGLTPLMVATNSGSVEVVRYLLQNGASVGRCTLDTNVTALHVAFGGTSVELCGLLLKYCENEDLYTPANKGRTPMMLAVASENEEMYEMLFSSEKFDARFSDPNRQTVLHYAAQSGSDKAIRTLLEKYDLDCNNQDSKGMTPLHLAAEGNHLSVTKVLLDTGRVDIDIQNENGESALQVAVAKCHTDVVKCLVIEGADVNIQNKKRETCLHIALTEKKGTVLAGNSDPLLEVFEDLALDPDDFRSDKWVTLALYLTKCGARIDLCDAKNLTPLDYITEEHTNVKETILNMVNQSAEKSQTITSSGGKIDLSFGGEYKITLKFPDGVLPKGQHIKATVKVIEGSRVTYPPVADDMMIAGPLIECLMEPKVTFLKPVELIAPHYAADKSFEVWHQSCTENGDWALLPHDQVMRKEDTVHIRVKSFSRFSPFSRGSWRRLLIFYRPLAVGMLPIGGRVCLTVYAVRKTKVQKIQEWEKLAKSNLCSSPMDFKVWKQDLQLDVADLNPNEHWELQNLKSELIIDSADLNQGETASKCSNLKLIKKVNDTVELTGDVQVSQKHKKFKSKKETFVIDASEGRTPPRASEKYPTPECGEDGLYRTRVMKVPDHLVAEQTQRLETFDMIGNVKGIAFVLNNQFKGTNRVRTGSQVDFKNVQFVLEELGYDIRPYEDLTKLDMAEKFGDFLKEASEGNYKSAVSVFMSHGKDDHIEGEDKTHISLKKCREKLANIATLKGKPKIIITQACRGKMYQVSDDGDGPSQNHAVEYNTEFLEFHATLKGQTATRHHKKGSPFISAFVEVLLERAHLKHLEDMMVEVTRRTVEKSKRELTVTNFAGEEVERTVIQVAPRASQMQKKLYFLPGI